MKRTIDRVCGIAIKGQNFANDLAAVQIITGDNTAGKTARKDAVTVALLGYHPALGKQPGKTIGLAPDSASVMEAGVRFSDGTQLQRKFTRTNSGASLKTEGEEPALAACQLDFSDFLAAKPTERHAILSSLMGRIDTGKIDRELGLQVAELGLGDFGFRLNAADDNPLTTLLGSVAEQGRAVKQSVDQSRKTLATLVAGEIPTQVDAGEIARAQAALNDANQRLGAARQEQAALQRRAAVVPPTEPPVAEPSEEECEVAESRYNALAEAVAADAPKLDAAMADLEAAQGRLAAARARLGMLTTRQKDFTEAAQQLKEKGTCPCCGCTGEALTESVDAYLAAEMERITGDTEAVNAEIEDATKAKDTASAAITIYRKQAEDCLAAEAALNETAARANLWHSYRSNAPVLPTQAELDAAAEAVEKVAIEATNAQETVASMRAAAAAYDVAVADRQRVADMTAEAEANERIVKNLATLKAWLQEQERAATAEAMKPLLAISDALLDGVVDGKLAVNGHMLGIRRGDQFLPLEVLSGMECAAVAAACQAAMATNSTLRLVIVDELGRMTDANARRFHQNCEQAVENGIIDQVLLIDPHGNRYGDNASILSI